MTTTKTEEDPKMAATKTLMLFEMHLEGKLNLFLLTLERGHGPAATDMVGDIQEAVGAFKKEAKAFIDLYDEK